MTPLTSSGIWPPYPPDAKSAHCARCAQRTAVLPPPRSGAHRRNHTVWDTRRLIAPWDSRQPRYQPLPSSKLITPCLPQQHYPSATIDHMRTHRASRRRGLALGSLPVFRRLFALGCGRAFSHPGGDRRSKQGSSGRLLGMRPVSSTAAAVCLAVKHANTRREQGTRLSSACGEREIAPPSAGVSHGTQGSGYGTHHCIQGFCWMSLLWYMQALLRRIMRDNTAVDEGLLCSNGSATLNVISIRTETQRESTSAGNDQDVPQNAAPRAPSNPTLPFQTRFHSTTGCKIKQTNGEHTRSGPETRRLEPTPASGGQRPARGSRRARLHSSVAHLHIPRASHKRHEVAEAPGKKSRSRFAADDRLS